MNRNFEDIATELLNAGDAARSNPVGWARRWAALAKAAGWPCYEMTWREWLAEVQAQFAPTAPRSEAQRVDGQRADGQRSEARQAALPGMPERWRW